MHFASLMHPTKRRSLIHTRIGRHIVLHIAAPDAKAADAQVREMCGKLLANPVTEDFEIAEVERA